MKELFRFIRHRTLCVACGIFLLVLTLGCYLPCGFLPTLTAATSLGFASTVVYAVVRRSVNATHPVVIAAAALLAAIVSQVYFGGYVARVEKLSGEVCRVKAEVIEPTYTTVYSTTYDVKVREVDGEKLAFKAELTTDFASGFSGGDILLFDGEFSDFSSNIAGFDEKRYNFSKGIFLALDAMSDVEVVDRALPNPLYLAVYANRILDNIIGYYVEDTDVAGYISGLFLGNGKNVPQTLKRDFKTLGLTHLLALSGMHLTVLTFFLDGLLRILHVKKPIRMSVSVLLVVFYMLISGMSASIVRSGIMLILSVVMQKLRIQYDAITSLFVAVTLICAFSPTSVADVGLILSFSATLGILTLARKTNKRLWKIIPSRKGHKIYTKIRHVTVNFLSVIVASFAAIVFTFPIVWAYFGEFSPVGIIATPLMSPLCNLMLMLSPLIILTSFIPPIARTFSELATLIYRLTAYFAEAVVDPSMLISLRYDFVKYIAVGFVVLTALLLLMKLKPRWSLLASGICAVTAFAVCLAWYNATTHDITRAAYLNYRTNDMLVLNSASSTLVCDISDGTRRPAREAVYAARSEFHTCEIDVYLLTHYHDRHTSTFAAIADSAYVRCLLLPLPTCDFDQAVAAELVSVAEERGIPVKYYTCGEPFDFGRATLTLDAAQTSVDGHPTIALSIIDGDSGVIYSGASAYGGKVYDSVTSDGAATNRLILGTHGPKEHYGVIAEKTDGITSVVTVSDRETAPVGFDDAELIVLEKVEKLASAVYKIE